MPRAGGVYTLPAGNPVVTLTVISSAWANTTMSDIATALTGSMPVDGSAPMTGPLRLADGAVGTPGLTWASETTSGWYKIGANQFGFSLAGVLSLSINANRGWTITTPVAGTNIPLTINGPTTSSTTVSAVGNVANAEGAAYRLIDGNPGNRIWDVGVALAIGVGVFEIRDVTRTSTCLQITSTGATSVNAASSGNTFTSTAPAAGGFAGSFVGANGTSRVLLLTATSGGGAAIQANDLVGTFLYGAGIITPGAWSVYDDTHSVERLKISSTGNISVAAPSSGDGVTITGAANGECLTLNGSASTGQSFGLLSTSGTNSSDWSALFRSQGGTNFLRIAGDGSLIGGTPTGGGQGVGTLNAVGLYAQGGVVSLGSLIKTTSTSTSRTSVTVTDDAVFQIAVPGAGTYEYRITLTVNNGGAAPAGIAWGMHYSGTFVASGYSGTGALWSTSNTGITSSANLAATVGGIALITTANLGTGAQLGGIVTGTLIATGAGTLAFAYGSTSTNQMGVGVGTMVVNRVA